MNGNYKNEIGNTYEDFVVIAESEYREPSNGCIKWWVKCRFCGRVFLYNGNALRFGINKYCQVCGKDRRKKARWP